jgi:hypothetical protein
MNLVTQHENPDAADLIFVFAGRQYRKTFAMRLYDAGRAPRILLSVARFEIRRFSHLQFPLPLDLSAPAAAVPPAQRHFFVLFDRGQCQVEKVPVLRFGTLGEVEALSAWLERNQEVRSVLVVSSSFHLRRVRMVCRAILPERVDIRYVAAKQESQESNWEDKLRSAYWRAAEVFKLAAYWFLLAVRKSRQRGRNSR